MTWYKGNDIIRESEDFKYETSGEVHRLVIAEVFPEDGGPYRAVASNDTGTTTSYFTVFVNGKLYFDFIALKTNAFVNVTNTVRSLTKVQYKNCDLNQADRFNNKHSGFASPENQPVEILLTICASARLLIFK